MRRLVTFLAAGLVVALVLAAGVSSLASSSPDGLERVAEDQGFADTATDHVLGDSPVADYAVAGAGDGVLSTGLAGVIGVLVTFALGLGLFLLVRRRARSHDTERHDNARHDNARDHTDVPASRAG